MLFQWFACVAATDFLGKKIIIYRAYNELSLRPHLGSAEAGQVGRQKGARSNSGENF
jgi:hypothetical protein